MYSPIAPSKKVKPTSLSRIIAGLATFAFAYVCHAAPGQATSVSNTQNSQTQNSSQGASQTELAREWGLTTQEWTRYQTVMDGPRGIYSPGLDPLTALGIEAKSEEERRRYAELQVQAERQRIDKELAYQKAYDQAFARLYPNEKVIQISSNPAPSAGTGAVTALKGTGRLAVFVQDSCTACIAKVKDLQAQKQSFDLYFVGSQGDDEKIRRWAILAGVEPTSVRNRQITLNHDAGRWLGLGLGGELPAVVREVNGQWQRQ
ncbi:MULTISPECIES: TIGR03759 family integrating conjugative element protein [Pseudomonadaceae]|uniref:TIGR03759 family integrating conjugative element protein n=1 Tax=Pseudomonas gessardii TaxID=78544 RepID=A0A7Y1MPB7_9PSED|nr:MULTISPECIES: TIGR03759 family integrating conjugative element protein [Pseudomonadaceae]MCF5508342.1 TIGR03759 family integrating conjugative element protein [Pseudomonas sp. PA-3-6H]MCF5517535.1 TIGR03759 family integrating conjugative element protein [Pseudomonas sp. PA-3-6E]MCF5562183.1 TIGR03759 family integrating conjugative element protein [Pseudomonas sp. PA-3-5D]MCF5569549.1 TIGR03759 family integrating conjugative element protein [Pseudomonas sp. PA-3-11C]MCF5592933.1 TIGR03759 fa